MRGFIVMLGDDQGLEQFSPYGLGGGTGGGGVEYPTLTNIAGLATGGWRAWKCYTQQLCSPTRATLLTGAYPFRHGVGDLVRPDFENPASQWALPETYPTLAETMLAAGYRTACFGKWHVGNTKVGGKNSPQRAGFETYVGNLHNLTGQNPSDPAADLLGFTDGEDYYDYMLVRNGDTVRGRQFYTTYLANLAIDFIKRCRARDEDFLLYLPWYNAHTPYSVPPSTHFRTAEWGAAPYGADGVPDTEIGLFKSLIEAMDYEIGRVLEHVDYTTDTVFFLTDNGTGTTTLDDGDGNFEYNPIEGEAYAPYLDVGGGLREYHGKDSPFETGVRVPLIVRGAGVTVAGNTVAATTDLYSVADIYPTIVELAGLTMPTTHTFDGISFVGRLQDTTYTPRTTVYTEWFNSNGPNTGDTLGNRKITNGTYTLIRGVNDGGSNGGGVPGSQSPDIQTATGDARLYNLDDDWQELTNLTPAGDGSDLAGDDLAAYQQLDEAMADLLAS